MNRHTAIILALAFGLALIARELTPAARADAASDSHAIVRALEDQVRATRELHTAGVCRHVHDALVGVTTALGVATAELGDRASLAAAEGRCV